MGRFVVAAGRGGPEDGLVHREIRALGFLSVAVRARAEVCARGSTRLCPLARCGRIGPTESTGLVSEGGSP